MITADCEIPGGRVVVYDMFVHRMDTKLRIGNRDLPPASRVVELRGDYLCLIGPAFPSAPSLLIFDLVVNGTSCQEFYFVDDPSYCTLRLLTKMPTRWQYPLDVQLTVDGNTVFRVALQAEQEPRSGFLSVATMVKYDQPYILEWIDYHRCIGVEHFYVYHNNSPDFKDVLKEVISKGVVTLLPWPHPYIVHPGQTFPWYPAGSHLYCQPPQQVHACTRFGQRWQWMALLDADEFLHPRQGTLLDLLHKNDPGNVTGLEIASRWYGSNYHGRVPGGPVLENYTRREEGFTSYPKVIASPKNLQAALIHWVYGCFPQVKIAPGVLHINHYRSISDHWNRRGETFDREYTNAVEDRHIIGVRDNAR